MKNIGIVLTIWGLWGASLFAQEIDVKSDLWTATDQLGRVLPNFSDVGDARQDKFVAMFYFLWLGRHGDAGPYDISKILAQDSNAINDPNHPLWGKMSVPHHWGESVFHYYVGEDESVLRKHAQMLADAGVDVICFDVTNQLTYPESYRPLFKVFSEMQKEGNRIPKIAFLCPFWSPTKVVKELWDEVYQKNFYSDVWFYWKGKPLILADPDLLVDSDNNVSTQNATPLLLTPESSIIQNFETQIEVKEIRLIFPTWTEKNSELSLILRENSSEGEIVEQIRATGIDDNETFVFSFPEPLVAGNYSLELCDPKGKIGIYSLSLGSKQLQKNEKFVWKEAFHNGQKIDSVCILQLIPLVETFSEIKNFFTFRAPQPDYFIGPQKANQWGWLEVYPQHKYYDEQGKTEQMCVGVAQNAVDGKLGVLSHPKSHGRSFHNGSEPDSAEQDTTGRNFQEQWNRALDIDPEIIFVTGWNEWIAGRFDANAPFNGATPVSFVDQFNQEFSRDIEPMIGGHADNYYYQLIANIRKFKGVRAPETINALPVKIDGHFEDWENVQPEYRDTIGDPVHRNCRGWGKGTQYINETGRNDFVAAKVSWDSDHVWFYVETQNTIIGQNEPNWMLLLINADQDFQTGPMGYEMIVQREKTENPHCLTVYYDFRSELDPQQNKTENSLKKICFLGAEYFCRSLETDFHIKGNQMELAVPRLLFPQNESLSFQFKWADNIQQTGDWADFTINGDSAPNDRFHYLYNKQ